MKPRTLILTATTVLLLSVHPTSAGTWSRFRGPNGQGISDANSIPIKWTDADYAWKIDLPGTGPSSPVVWNDKVFLTSADSKAPKGMLQAINAATGDILWQKDYPLPKSRMNSLNSYAACTPALTEDRVYVLWCTESQTSLIALDHSGQQMFRKEFGPTSSSHGPGVSPMVCNGMVIFTHEQRDGQTGCWIAADAQTGEIEWTIKRSPGQISYSTPCLYTPPGSAEQLIFTSWAHGIIAVSPADGTVLWESADALTARVVSSPVIGDGFILGSCGQGGSGKRLTAVVPPADPDGKPEIAWTAQQSATTPYVPTSLCKDGLLYTFQDQGMVACRTVDTGEIIWNEKPGGKFYGSPIWLDNRIYCITREGRCIVLQASRTYSLLASNDLGEPSDSTPAVADERMYLRTASKLMCLQAKDR